MCATRCLNESKRPRGERMDGICWREGHSKWRARGHGHLVLFHFGMALHVKEEVDGGERGQKGAGVGPGGTIAWPAGHLITP